MVGLNTFDAYSSTYAPLSTTDTAQSTRYSTDCPTIETLRETNTNIGSIV